jgi:predicted NUDIX family NTP pyrophosphohydrolase
MPRMSAGILLYRAAPAGLEVLLVHPGGPFWKNKDEGAWTIPKGEVAPNEGLEATARREFLEELGSQPPAELTPLAPVKQKGGKLVHAFAAKGDLDTSAFKSNTFTVEWPPRSGKFATFPEVDRAEWFDLGSARLKINAAQTAFLDELQRIAGGESL